MKLRALFVASAIALAACSGGGDTMPTRQQISEITVQTDLQSIGNSAAVAYWQNLGTDLKTALAAEFVNDISPDGAVMLVDVDELSLANAYSSKFQGENSTLSGVVTLMDSHSQPTAVYNVSATSSQAMAYMNESSGVTSVSPGSAEFYTALVTAFARGVEAAVNAPASGS